LLPRQESEHGWHVAGLRRPKHPLPALPAAGIDQEALHAAVSDLEASGTTIGLLPTPERLKRLLVASAQPVRGYQPFQVGAGFISETTTNKFLGAFSAADLGEFFGEPRPSPELRERLRGMRLVDCEMLPRLVSVWRESMLKWGADLADFSTQDRPTLEITNIPA